MLLVYFSSRPTGQTECTIITCDGTFLRQLIVILLFIFVNFDLSGYFDISVHFDLSDHFNLSGHFRLLGNLLCIFSHNHQTCLSRCICVYPFCVNICYNVVNIQKNSPKWKRTFPVAWRNISYFIPWPWPSFSVSNVCFSIFSFCEYLKNGTR